MHFHFSCLPKFCFVLFMLVQGSIYAQTDKNEEERKRIIEKLIENRDEGADYSDWVDQLDFYMRNPIGLNTGDLHILVNLGLLNEIQYQAIESHRAKYGGFVSVYELRVIEELDEYTLRIVIRFVTMKGEPTEKLTMKNVLKFSQYELSQQGMWQLPLNEGQKRRINHDTAGRSYYDGNPLRTVSRFRVNYKNKIAIGYTGEKDAGESFLRGTNKNGYDYNSLYIMFAGGKYVKQCIVGDYNILFGQGLTFGSGISFGKSAMVMQVRRLNAGIRPNRSVNENEFLRGIAMHFSYKKWSMIVFHSDKKNDASINFDTLSGDDGSAVLASTGLHRTPNEIASEKQIRQRISGVRGAFQSRNFQIGINSAYIYFDKSISPSNKLYKLNSFSGKSNLKTGVDYQFFRKNYFMFGEFSFNDNGQYAMIHSILVNLSRNTEYIAVIRNYQPGFQPLVSAGWGESVLNENETGWYQGLVIRPSKQWTVSSYFDIYYSPWLKYRLTTVNNYSYDYLNEVSWTPSKSLTIYMRTRGSHYQVDSDEGYKFSKIKNVKRHSSRLHISYKYNMYINLNTRIEYARYSESGGIQQGTVWYQDIDYKPRKGKWHLSARFTAFSVNGYGARIYVYEDDLPFTFSVPSFQNSGSKLYILFKYRISRNWDLSFRPSVTGYYNTETVGSGLDETPGNIRADFKIQLRGRW